MWRPFNRKRNAYQRWSSPSYQNYAEYQTMSWLLQACYNMRTKLRKTDIWSSDTMVKMTNKNLRYDALHRHTIPSPLEKHNHLTVRGVRKQIHRHRSLGDKRLRVRHGLRPLPSETSSAHRSPSSVAFVLFLFLRCWGAQLDRIGD